MKKALIAVLIVLFMAALVVTGCGGEKTKTVSDSEAQKILEDSTQKMQDVTAMKATGDYKMTTSGEGAQDMEFTFEMEMDLEDQDNPIGRMVLRGMGQDSDMYIVDNYMYVSLPEGWVKTPYAESDSFSQSTPSELAEVMEGAENLRITSEDSATYEISVDLGEDFMRRAMELDQGTEELGEEFQQMMEDLVKNMKMSAVFTISKETMYVENTKINMEITDFPMVGDMNLVMNMSMSDYNQPVAVSLPPEALDAREVTSEELGTTGIPSFPGLGL